MGGAFVVDMGIQLVGWAFAAALKTEKFYDLCGSLAFASTAALTFASSGGLARQVLATSMVWFSLFSLSLDSLGSIPLTVRQYGATKEHFMLRVTR